MKLTGPEGLPPPESFSRLDRRVERSVPVPEPNLKSMASLWASRMMPSMSSRDALDEAGRGLGRLVGAGGLDHSAGLLVPPPVVGRPGNPVAMKEPHVEPDRRVERPVLVQAQGRQLVVEPLGVLGGREVAVVAAPVGDRPGHAVDELADRVLPLALRRGAVAAGHVAVEVLAGHDVGGELAPAAGDLAIRLLEDRPAALVLDLGRAEVPVDLVERADPLGAENPGNLHPRPLPPPVPGALRLGPHLSRGGHQSCPFAYRCHVQGSL